MNATEIEAIRQAINTGPSWIRHLEVLVLAVTGGIVFWYTRETKRLRKETQKQTDVMIKPLLIIHVQNGFTKISNIGNATAINIKLSEIEKPDGTLYYPKFEIPYLRTNDSCKIYFCDAHGEKISSTDVNPLFEPEHFIDIEEALDVSGEFSEITNYEPHMLHLGLLFPGH